MGNRSVTTTNAYGIRWVQNIHCLFTEICIGNSRYRERCSFCSQSVWVINVVAIYRGLTVINFNDFPTFRLTVYLALQFLDTHKSQTLRSEIHRLHHRKMEYIKYSKLIYIMICLLLYISTSTTKQIAVLTTNELNPREPHQYGDLSEGHPAEIIKPNFKTLASKYVRSTFIGILF